MLFFRNSNIPNRHDTLQFVHPTQTTTWVDLIIPSPGFAQPLPSWTNQLHYAVWTTICMRTRSREPILMMALPWLCLVCWLLNPGWPDSNVTYYVGSIMKLTWVIGWNNFMIYGHTMVDWNGPSHTCTAVSYTLPLGIIMNESHVCEEAGMRPTQHLLDEQILLKFLHFARKWYVHLSNR